MPCGWALMLRCFGQQAATIDCTFDIATGPAGLRAAIERVRLEAETAVRSGKSQLFLTDARVLAGEGRSDLNLDRQQKELWLKQRLAVAGSTRVKSGDQLPTEGVPL